jgi:hypothetical protein
MVNVELMHCPSHAKFDRFCRRLNSRIQAAPSTSHLQPFCFWPARGTEPECIRLCAPPFAPTKEYLFVVPHAGEHTQWKALVQRLYASSRAYLYTEQVIDLHCLVYKSCCHSYEARLKIRFTAQQTNPMFQLATTRIYLVFVKG